MTGRRLLDTDMQTLVQWLADAARWWIGEMRDLVPERLRRSGSASGPRSFFIDGVLQTREGRGASRVSAGRRTIVMVPASACLARIIERPVVADRDLQRMVAIEASALLPFPADEMVAAARVVASGVSGDTPRIEVAALPIVTARAVSAAITAAGVTPERILVERPDAGVAIDFTQAMRAAGLIPPRSSVTLPIWGVVAVLLILNVASLVWRDDARVERLERLVRDQAPAVATARRIDARLRQERRLVARTIALRRSQDAQAILEGVSAALPQGAWLQRYAWDGATVRLTGYRPPKVDIATALRGSGRFVDVRALDDETPDAVGAADPFDLSARIVVR